MNIFYELISHFHIFGEIAIQVSPFLAFLFGGMRLLWVRGYGEVMTDNNEVRDVSGSWILKQSLYLASS